MKIEEFLFNHFASNNWKWSIKGKGLVEPTKEDFTKALDLAIEMLYAEGKSGGNMLQVGRLIIIRNNDSFDIYVMAGTIESNNNQGEK